jgi:hypothetical protein
VLLELGVGLGLGWPANPEAETAQEPRNVVILVDHHIVPDIRFPIDERVLRTSIRGMLKYVRPLRVVAFAVGHDGHAQYPSAFFPPQAPSPTFPYLKSPGQDLLKIWREETARAHVQLIVYVSTLRNNALVEARPDYARVGSNGAVIPRIDHNTRFIDEVLLPGLQEIIDRYDPDGFFLDGDYWTVQESWNPASTAKFEAQAHVPAPRDPADPNYARYVRFTYSSYRDDYVEKLAAFFEHQKRRLNWSINAAFTVRDPSPLPKDYGTPTIDLPFFALGEAYVESLFGQRRDRESEIVYALFAQMEGAMAYQYKSAAQLKQELAAAVANRFLPNFYLPLSPDGTIPLGPIETAMEVYDQVDKEVGVELKQPGDTLVADLALVDDNADAIARRNFTVLKDLSTELFETGVAHAIISDSEAAGSRFSHLIFPQMQIVGDPALLPGLLAAGKKMLWPVSLADADGSVAEALRQLRASPGVHDAPAPPGCDPEAACEALVGSSGGALWVVPPEREPQVLGAFLADLPADVSFPDKPRHVYALAYRNEAAKRLTIYLTSVAWGGVALGRHSIFDQAELIPGLTLTLATAARCTQYGSSGVTEFETGTTIHTAPFDAITRIVCEP